MPAPILTGRDVLPPVDAVRLQRAALAAWETQRERVAVDTEGRIWTFHPCAAGLGVQAAAYGEDLSRRAVAETVGGAVLAAASAGVAGAIAACAARLQVEA